MTGQAGVNVFESETVGSLKNLNDCLIFVSLDDTAEFLFRAVDRHFHDLIVSGILNAL